MNINLKEEIKIETEKMKRIEAARDEICLLRCHLESSASEIGDWKIVKIYEYRLQGKEDPYDFEKLPGCSSGC